MYANNDQISTPYHVSHLSRRILFSHLNLCGVCIDPGSLSARYSKAGRNSLVRQQVFEPPDQISYPAFQHERSANYA